MKDKCPYDGTKLSRVNRAILGWNWWTIFETVLHEYRFCAFCKVMFVKNDAGLHHLVVLK